VDEARKVIQRLERIEALQSAQAPADELLGEVRQLLSEGEAWLAAERGGSGNGAECVAGGGVTGAAAALAGCRATLAKRKEAAQTTETRAL
jgi:hypothetical protein